MIFEKIFWLCIQHHIWTDCVHIGLLICIGTIVYKKNDIHSYSDILSLVKIPVILLPPCQEKKHHSKCMTYIYICIC